MGGRNRPFELYFNVLNLKVTLEQECRGRPSPAGARGVPAYPLFLSCAAAGGVERGPEEVHLKELPRTSIIALLTVHSEVTC